MGGSETIYVLDTSALLTLIEGEDGSEIVQSVLQDAISGSVKIFVSFMSFMEVFYITIQERGLGEAEIRLNLIESLPVTRIESSSHLTINAAILKAKHHISVADAWIAALAIDKNATLIHKDPEFEDIGEDLQVLKLPYKISDI